MEWCRLWWLLSSVGYNKPTVEQLNLFPLPLCPFYFLSKPKTHEKRFILLLLCSSGKKDKSAWRSWRFGGGNNWPQGAGKMSSRGGKITKPHTNLFPWQGVLHKSWGGAERQTDQSFKYTRTVVALRPTGKSLNPHFRTESLLLFNLNKINPKTSVLTPGQVDQTHFFTPSKSSPLCLSCSKKKIKNTLVECVSLP